MKILVVEDDLVLSLLLNQMIERIGHEVVDVLTEGESAIDSMENGDIDLILMDIMLDGEIDGIQAMERIRATSKVPVIYITGNSDQRTIDRARNTGFNDYLIKPVSYEQLKSSIERIS